MNVNANSIDSIIQIKIEEKNVNVNAEIIISAKKITGGIVTNVFVKIANI